MYELKAGKADPYRAATYAFRYILRDFTPTSLQNVLPIHSNKVHIIVTLPMNYLRTVSFRHS